MSTNRRKANFPILLHAYQVVRDLIEANEGFTFRVRTHTGDTFEGIPPSTSPLEPPVDGILMLEAGADVVVIPHSSIETIVVVAC